jgi:hypothetical protein
LKCRRLKGTENVIWMMPPILVFRACCYFALYDKNEMADLGGEQKDRMREQLKAELRRRNFN